ncbi:hypothetical protein KN1_08360 [Stygiolobus caldivivus]|uniref:6-hydroxymethyl-7,8-dihydropterin pyrophosphokinase n=1 Tax=Stygiolobus caldivivus TaxID=2824673 RepID=A0A8D5ZHB2_9CREN|nr:hypothetical protein KN1_08360 [Stygiolobus caldivivus]
MLSGVDDYTEDLAITIKGKKVAVVGAGPNLEDVRDIDADVIISADGATNYLVSRGIEPDVIVTDLDGLTVYPYRPLYVILAHGNNIDMLKEKVHHLRDKKVIGTSQVFPFGRLKLFGGFTDGDRGVVLASVFGAKSIVTYGMDFDSGVVGKYSKPYYKNNLPASWTKRNKLKIAKYIIEGVFSKTL